jgi:hypothetical protein
MRYCKPHIIEDPTPLAYGTKCDNRTEQARLSAPGEQDFRSLPKDWVTEWVSHHVAEIKIENPATSLCPAIRISSPRTRFELRSTRPSTHDDQLREPHVMRGADDHQPALLSGICRPCSTCLIERFRRTRRITRFATDVPRRTPSVVAVPR